MPSLKKILVSFFVISFIGSVGIIIIFQQGIPGLHVAYEVYVQNNHAFVTNNDGTIIFDISNPSHPVKIGGVLTSDGAFGVYVENDTLFIASDSDGFIMANISIPEDPVIIGEHSDGGSANSVCFEGSYAYVTEYPRGFEILDITDPKAITKVSFYDDGGEFRNVAVKDGLAYLADPATGLKVINISDPTSPERIRTVSGTHGVIDLYIYEDLLFLGCHGNGVRILDISTPQSPIVLGQYYKTEGEAYGVTGNATHLYVADLQQGVYLLNITDPKRPIEIMHYSEAVPHDIFYDGKYIYLADQDTELNIFDSNLALISRSAEASVSGFEIFFVIACLFTVLITRKIKH